MEYTRNLSEKQRSYCEHIYNHLISIHWVCVSVRSFGVPRHVLLRTAPAVVVVAHVDVHVVQELPLVFVIHHGVEGGHADSGDSGGE